MPPSFPTATPARLSLYPQDLCLACAFPGPPCPFHCGPPTPPDGPTRLLGHVCWVPWFSQNRLRADRYAGGAYGVDAGSSARARPETTLQAGLPHAGLFVGLGLEAEGQGPCTRFLESTPSRSAVSTFSLCPG